MSVEFTLTGSSLALADWDRLVEARYDEELNGEPEASFSESGMSHFLVEGSVRGVLLYHDGSPGLITVRLGALSSRADWQVAYELVREALGEGGGSFEREDGQVLTAEALSAQAAQEQALADFVPTVQSVRGMFESEEAGGEIALPLGRFSLRLDASDLPAECGEAEALELEAILAERVQRYGPAFHANLFVLEGGVKVGTWAQIPTVLGSTTHLVACSAFEHEQGLIPADRLPELLPDRVERLGNGGLYLPQIELAEEPELRAALEQELVQVEAWAAENAERLAEEAEAAARRPATRLIGSDDEETETHRAMLKLVAVCMMTGQQEPLEDLERQTDAETVGSMVQLIGMTLQRMMGEDPEAGELRDPQIVFQELNAAGVPSALAALALEAIAEVLQGGPGGG